MAAQLNNCDGTKILSRKLFKVAMAPEGLRREDAQRELLFPRSNEEAGKFYGERKPFLMSIGTGQNTGYIFEVDNGSWNILTQRGKGHVSPDLVPCYRFTTLKQLVPTSNPWICMVLGFCAISRRLFQHSFLEDGANVGCLIHCPSNTSERAAEHLMFCIFLHFQLKVSFGKETG